jgi:DNA polymerase III sliding clamp (beta) subunit (PCNA family)
MKVSINVKQFQEILDILGKFVSKHSTLPILENIYLKTNIDTLILRATDMEKYVEISLPTKIHAE